MSTNASGLNSGFSSLSDRASEPAARALLFVTDPVERELLERYIRNRSTDVIAFEALEAALSQAAPADVVVLRLTASTGAAPVEIARQRLSSVSVLALAEDAQTAIAAYRLGADIVAQLPMDLDLLCCKIEVLAQRARQLLPQQNPDVNGVAASG